MKRVKDAIARLRARSRLADHVIMTIEHYNTVRGGMLAGGITYFGFLSFFPILALAFFVVGYVKQAFPGSEDALRTAIEQVLPGIISRDPNPPNGQLSFDQIENAKAFAGVVGLLGVLYSGLGWLSALRQALVAVFEVPDSRQDNFAVGKGKDLVMLVLLGLVLVVSVSVAGLVTGFARDILDAVGLSGLLSRVLLQALAVVVGLAASTLLFFTMYRLLPGSSVRSADMWRGALLAAVGFEVLKQLAFLVLGGASGSALAPLAVSLTLVVWIYYFARITIYGASWAYTRSHAPDDSAFPPSVPPPSAPPPTEEVAGASTAAATPGRTTAASTRPAVVVGALALAVWAWFRRERS